MKLVSALIIFFSLNARAEYRMFLLQITSEDGNQRLVKSNLDPDQYRGYYTVLPNEKLTYIDTWMCKGRTNSQPPCPSPREATADASASSP